MKLHDHNAVGTLDGHPLANIESVVRRFWAKVSRGDDCWIWTGSRDHAGYGWLRIKLGGRSRAVKAHRLSLALHGTNVPASGVGLHGCDNPPCVRPHATDHVRLGSLSQNAQDAVAKGRLVAPALPGEANPASVLSEEAVREIFLAPGKQRDIAAAHGVSQRTVWQIKHRLVWRAVTAGLEAPPIRRTIAPRALCRRGHALTEDNVRTRRDGGRQCRTCANAAARRNYTAKRLGLSVAALCLTFIACTNDSAATSPNVVLIVADDLRYDDVRFLPSVQELAARGTSFQRAFAPYSLCTPSRASILSGNTPAVHGVRDNRGQNFDASSTLAVWLQNAGYRTGLVGKYLNKGPHTGWPQQPGWEFWKPIHRHDDYGRDQANVLLAQSAEFISEPDRRPFLLYVAPAGPHGPLWGPPSCDAESAPPMPHPVSFDPQFEGSTLETKRWPQRLSSLCGIDHLISGIVSTLSQRGVLENTLVIFTSDQGYHLGEHGEVGKMTLFEEVVRVPLVISGPSFDARSSNRIVSLVDIAPTVAELAGADVPEIEGRSMLSGEERRFAPIEARNCTGKRRAHSKVTWCGDVTRVFDLANDPLEMSPVVMEAP